MIIVDTSAVVAIFRHEAEEVTFTDLLDGSSASLMSAVSYVEAQMVLLGRRLRIESSRIESVIASLGIQVADVTRDQIGLAVHAFISYGKGRHPARLNIADCFAYALAKSHSAPLLFKGDDFSRTDIVPAWR